MVKKYKQVRITTNGLYEALPRFDKVRKKHQPAYDTVIAFIEFVVEEMRTKNRKMNGIKRSYQRKVAQITTK